MLYMFRTVLVHHQEQHFISCTSHLVHAGTIRVAIATQQTDVPAYTRCDVQLTKFLLMMDKYSRKHVEHLIENKV